MKIFNRTIVCKQATANAILRGCVGLFLVLAFASTTMLGQGFTFINPPTTTTPYVVPATAPTSGLILPGTNLNALTGQPVRFLWYGDAGAGGFCRVDPDVDSAGPHAINPATCITTVNGIGFTPGPAAYDPLNGNIYVVNQQKAAQGVFRLPYDPAADGGNGLISPAAVELAGVPSGKVVNVGCPFNSAFVTPNALALGAGRQRLHGI